MIRVIIFLVLVFVGNSVYAKSKCDDINGKLIYPPLSMTGGMVCFVLEPVSDQKNEFPVGMDSISLFYIENGNVPVKAEGRGLLYDDTPGEIVDAFSLNIDHEYQEKLFVIHFMEVRDSLAEPDSSGKFYSVSVFSPAGGILRRDERASDWFGADYSWLSDGKKIIYRFPYQSRKDIRRAIDSPFASLMNGDDGIPVRVKFKTYLFEDPGVRSRTRKYLIKGDRAIVEKVTAGWCNISYSGGVQPLNMWSMCDALAVDAGKNNGN